MGPSLPMGSLSPPLPLALGGSLGGFLGVGEGSLGALGSKGSAPCRGDIWASREFGGGANFAGVNRLGRWTARKRIEF